MIKKISSVAVVVSDGEKSAKWYNEKLGFEIKSQKGHWITVGPKESEVTLHLCKGPPLEAGNTGIRLIVDDIDKTYEELSSKGVEFTTKPRDDGRGKYARFKDPDGNEFWLAE